MEWQPREQAMSRHGHFAKGERQERFRGEFTIFCQGYEARFGPNTRRSDCIMRFHDEQSASYPTFP